VTTFIDWRDLPPPIKAHLDALEEFIGQVDGKTLATQTTDDKFIDDGTVDAEDAVKAVNGLVVALRVPV
jgi:hypothetical protein